jgi:hypothetical protein
VCACNFLSLRSVIEKDRGREREREKERDVEYGCFREREDKSKILV